MSSVGEGSGSGVPLDPAAYEAALAAQREVINAADLEIVGALNRRTAAAIEIGKLKDAHGQPIYVPGREEEVLERTSAANDSEIVPDPTVREFFAGIMKIGRDAQQRVQGKR